MDVNAVSSIGLCPVCGSLGNKATIDPPVGNLKPNRYTNAISNGYQVEFEQIVTEFSLWECQECKCIYWDPFFSLEARNILYSKKFNDHGAGWSVFLKQNYLKKDHKDSIQAAALILVLNKYINVNIKNYAEVNCPFLGLVPHITNIVEQPPKIINDKLEDAKSRGLIYSIYMRFIKFYIDYKFGKKKCSNHSFSKEGLTNVSLISIPTTNGWGPMCNRFGIGCNHLIESIPFDYVIKKDMRFDLIGFFNTFDHLDDPLRSLNLTLKQSENIIIQIHPWSHAGPQHAFYLPPYFWENLEKLVDNVRVTNISDEVKIESGMKGNSDQYYLIQRC